MNSRRDILNNIARLAASVEEASDGRIFVIVDTVEQLWPLSLENEALLLAEAMSRTPTEAWLSYLDELRPDRVRDMSVEGAARVRALRRYEDEIRAAVAEAQAARDGLVRT